MSSIDRNCTDGLATLITVNIIGKTFDELRVLMLLRWIGRDVFGDMRFAVYVPQRLSSRLLSARSNSSVGLAGTMARMNSTIDSIHRWRLRRFETCLRCPA